MRYENGEDAAAGRAPPELNPTPTVKTLEFQHFPSFDRHRKKSKISALPYSRTTYILHFNM
jgi:hypothetical protein